METPGIEQMVKELREAGWLPVVRTVWQSPDGGFYLGPFGAWREMKKAAAPSQEPSCR
jgi:hypothetical protein